MENDEFDHDCDTDHTDAVADAPVYGMNLQAPNPLRYDLMWIATRFGSRLTYLISDTFDALGSVVQFRGMVAANQQGRQDIENDLRAIVGVGDA